MKSELKFPKAFCKKTNGDVTPSDVFTAYAMADGTFGDTYQKHLFCPECKTAQLVFNSRKSGPYFRALDTQAHLEGCSHFLREKETPRKTPVESGLVTDDDRQAQMLYWGNKLMSSPATNDESDRLGKPRRFRKASRKTLTTATPHLKRNRLPEKSILQGISANDFNQEKLYKGHVLIRWETNESKGKGRIMAVISHPKTGNPLLHLTVTPPVQAHMKPTDISLCESPKKCILVLVAEIKHKPDKDCPEVALRRSNYIYLVYE